jgi:hypothetical protein
MSTVPGAIIVYHHAPSSPTEANRFCQKIYGQATSTGGRSYRRKGVLDEIPHWRPAKNVVVVREGDREVVVRALRKWTREIRWWSIPLAPVDVRRLKCPLG